MPGGQYSGVTTCTARTCWRTAGTVVTAGAAVAGAGIDACVSVTEPPAPSVGNDPSSAAAGGATVAAAGAGVVAAVVVGAGGWIGATGVTAGVASVAWGTADGTDASGPDGS